MPLIAIAGFVGTDEAWFNLSVQWLHATKDIECFEFVNRKALQATGRDFQESHLVIGIDALVDDLDIGIASRGEGDKCSVCGPAGYPC